MTIRNLPEMRRPDAPHCSFVLNEKALKAWSPGVMPEAAADEDDATISILDVIGYDWWTGEGVTAKRVSAALRSIGNKPVKVLVNSPGGDFFEGVTIYNMLRLHPAKVTVQILGIAASAASVIAMAGDEVQIGKTGFIMTHNTQWAAAGDRHVMRQTGDIMETFDVAMNELYAERTGQKVATIAAWNDAEHWIAGQTAIDEGFADSLLAVAMKAGDGARNQAATLYQIEDALARQGMPRSERRRIMKELTEGTPSAALRNAMPGAGDDDGADLGLDFLRLASARLSLTRA